MTDAQRKQFVEIRKALDGFINKIADNPAEINDNPAAIRIWMPGAYVAGDVRIYEGIPYKSAQAHNSAANPEWTPAENPALWTQYHGTSIETARPWIIPTGAHDMYRVGECMIWTDGSVYRCISDTIYSPADYAAAWEKAKKA